MWPTGSWGSGQWERQALSPALGWAARFWFEKGQKVVGTQPTCRPHRPSRPPMIGHLHPQTAQGKCLNSVLSSHVSFWLPNAGTRWGQEPTSLPVTLPPPSDSPCPLCDRTHGLGAPTTTTAVPAGAKASCQGSRQAGQSIQVPVHAGTTTLPQPQPPWCELQPALSPLLPGHSPTGHSRSLTAQKARRPRAPNSGRGRPRSLGPPLLTAPPASTCWKTCSTAWKCKPPFSRWARPKAWRTFGPPRTRWSSQAHLVTRY